MIAVKQYPGLYERNGRYFYRAVVPERLRSIIGKTEFKRTLGTDSLREARLRWAEAGAEFDRIKREAEQHLNNGTLSQFPSLRVLRLADVEPLVREWHAFRLDAEFNTLERLCRSERTDSARIAAIEEEYKLYVDLANWRWRESARSVIEHLCDQAGFERPAPGTLTFNTFADRINAARVDLSKRVLHRINDDFSEHPPGADPSFAQSPDAVGSVNPSSQESNLSVLLLGEEIDRYVNDPARGVSEGTRKANRSRLRVLEEYFGADQQLVMISGRDMEAFRNLLLELPRDAFRALPGVPVKDMPEAARVRGLQIVQRKNARLTFETISSFFKKYAERGEIPRNPCSGLAIKKDRSEGKSRSTFKAAELQRVFSDPIVYSPDSDERHVSYDGAFWVPLIAAFTGMRLGEVCQLWTDDVNTSAAGIPHFKVRHDPGRKQRAKSKTSEREVPVHRELVRLGFLKWVKDRRSDKPDRLFPEIPYSKAGSVSDIFSKRFRTRLQRLGLAGDGLVFHSFRHSFIDAMRNAGIDEETRKRISGHAANDVHFEYGQGPALGRVKEAVDRVWYEDETDRLDLSGITPYRPDQ